MAKLFVCGDICNSLLDKRKAFISDEVKSFIKDADYSICNLEGVESPDIYAPHQETGTISYLKSCGFNLCLLANNHITDGGGERLHDTITKLKNNDLDYVGAGFCEDEVYSPFIKEIGGGILLDLLIFVKHREGTMLTRLVVMDMLGLDILM